MTWPGLSPNGLSRNNQLTRGTAAAPFPFIHSLRITTCSFSLTERALSRKAFAYIKLRVLKRLSSYQRSETGRNDRLW